MLDELADAVGCRHHVATITARAMAGEINFIAALRERVALLAGLSSTVLDQVAARIELTPGALALVQTMRHYGAVTALVSGGFDCFASLVSRWCNFDIVRANQLQVDCGRITGKVVEPILDHSSKVQTLYELLTKHKLTAIESIAVGDGANDLPVLLAAGLGVAFHAKPLVQQQVQACIKYNDLTALLYAQGYRSAEIIDVQPVI
jgi:phosphoserine phosphatase